MDERPLPPLEELIAEALDPRAHRISFGLPHPLSKFGNDDFKDGPHADLLLEYVQDTVWEEPESAKFKGAMWFLLESERTFFLVCSEAGIDAEKLRNHLRLCKQLSVDEMDGLLEERERGERP